ncbi:MAG: hypothetical protein AB1665_04260 [Candidatus Thermoplasmatota archaeon]
MEKDRDLYEDLQRIEKKGRKKKEGGIGSLLSRILRKKEDK